jgi:hypothetical protein
MLVSRGMPDQEALSAMDALYVPVKTSRNKRYV